MEKSVWRKQKHKEIENTVSAQIRIAWTQEITEGQL